MIGSEEQTRPAIGCLIRQSKDGRTRLERFSIERGGQKTWTRPQKERFYFLLDARGAFTVGALGARWQFETRSDTAIWVPAGLEHTLKNSGDAPSRGIVFCGTLGEGETKGEKEVPESPTVLDLHSVPQRNMVSFLSRTLHTGGGVARRAFLLSEYQTVLPGGWVPKHVHESREEICYVCKGVGKLHAGRETKTVSAGEAVRIPPGFWHSMANENEDILEYILVQAASLERDIAAKKGETGGMA